MTYEQPDSTTFQAMYTYEDNFSWYMETDDGYAIIRNPNVSYYYYSQLDSTGEYTWTNLKVVGQYTFLNQVFFRILSQCYMAEK